MSNKSAVSIALFAVLGMPGAVHATGPCGDFGECKVLIETNSSDGDIGFHFLFDGDEIVSGIMIDPNHRMIYRNRARGPLREQFLTENFAESSEPLCWKDPDADPDEEIVTLEEFLDRWTPGVYKFLAFGGQGVLFGETSLTYNLPAAPADIEFDDSTGVISWAPGDDLGNCASNKRLTDLVGKGDLPMHPQDVPIAAWEAVFEPDVDGPVGSLTFSVRVAPDQTSVTVPADYLASLPSDTPAKFEVGAIGVDDNATFTEEDGVCVNEVEGCEDD